MKTMHKLLALLLAAALCCGICLIPSAAADETAVGRPAVVQAGAVNVRKSPSESADRIGGLTLGIRTIMHARRIVLVAKGAHKAEMVRQMILGPVTEDIPASVLQLHPNCEFLLDAQAASLLD